MTIPKFQQNELSAVDAPEKEPTQPYRLVRSPEISGQNFSQNHLDKGFPVIFRGLTASWPACGRWSADYFSQLSPTLVVPVKTYASNSINVQSIPIGAYAQLIKEMENSTASSLPYCHDVALFEQIPELINECPFDATFLPNWYQRKWWRYAQFFIGPKASLTPLHFDTLLTHNLFFQITGRKRFTLYSPRDLLHCGRRGWRWFDYDPERPDYQRFPSARHTTPLQIEVEAGDVLYLPPGTLHHVRGLDESVSFNIDFHSATSVLSALRPALKGMPLTSTYYNLITALGVVGQVPSSILFGAYKRYLSYVS
jgi:hypothetical protein